MKTANKKREHRTVVARTMRVPTFPNCARKNTLTLPESSTTDMTKNICSPSVAVGSDGIVLKPHPKRRQPLACGRSLNAQVCLKDAVEHSSLYGRFDSASQFLMSLILGVTHRPIHPVLVNGSFSTQP